MSFSHLGTEQIANRLYPRRAELPVLPGPWALTEQHLADFQREGVLAIADVFSKDEVEAARDGLSRLIAGDRPDFRGIQFEDVGEARGERESSVRKLFDFTLHDDRLKAMAEKPSFLAIVEKLVGSEVFLSQEMALLKPPRIGREKPWHQDGAYFLFDPPSGVIGTWIALDEATPENGCMHVIPGSHLGGPRPHYHDRDCQLADEDVEVDRAVMVPLTPGGVLFFGGLVHHGTPPNQSPSRRWALQFHYASVHCKKADANAHRSAFLDELGEAGCTGHLTGRPARPVSHKPG